MPRRYGPAKTRRTALPHRDRCRFAPFWTCFAHVWRESSVDLNSPNLGEFRMFFEDDRTYSDYMKLAEFGNMKHFTRTFANLSEASN